MKKIITILLLLSITNLSAQNINTTTKTDPQRVFNDTLLIFYGETLYFEATMDGDKITGYKQVDRIADSSKTLEIKVTPGFTGKNSTTLSLRNPFSGKLNYKAMIKAAKKKAVFEETSVIPVYPKIFSMEMWGFKAEAIMLRDIKIN